MKTRKNVILALFALGLLMVFSFNVFSQGDKGKVQESACASMMRDEATMKECMKQMGEEACKEMMASNEMMEMCGKMMSDMKEGSAMCNMMGKHETKENKSEVNKKQMQEMN